MIFKVIIPARKNSKRLQGKNMKMLGGKPLVQHSIDFAKKSFLNSDIWINSDDPEILRLANTNEIMSLSRPDDLGGDFSSTADVLKHHANYFKQNKIVCDAIILLQPTNPFRGEKMLEEALRQFNKFERSSLATFSVSEKKLGKIEDAFFEATNYVPGQRSQDMEKLYFENGLLYITKIDSILDGAVITDDVYPLICDDIESTVDIDSLNDFMFAEFIWKSKNERE